MLLSFSSAVQDAASRKSNNLLLDTSDLAISQYSLLGQTPPRSAPDSPAIHVRGSSSAVPDENNKSIPEVETEGLTVTADVCPRSDPEHSSDNKSDPSTTSDQKGVLLSPVIVVTQQPDESVIEDTSCVNETTKEVQLEAEKPSTTDSATTESPTSGTPDSDAAVTHETGTPDLPSIPEPTNSIPESPNPSTSTLSSLQSIDVPAESAPETSATSEQISEDGSSSLPCCSSPSIPPCTDGPVKLSLGSLSEAIGSSSTASSVEQVNTQQPTDRAVYLTGEIKDNWEVERAKEEKEKEAAQEKSEGRVEEEEEGGELEKRNDEEEAEENGEHEEQVEEEVLQTSQLKEPQPEDCVELPVDSVALIRELVTEVSEVKLVVSPCPNSALTHTSPWQLQILTLTHAYCTVSY